MRRFMALVVLLTFVAGFAPPVHGEADIPYVCTWDFVRVQPDGGSVYANSCTGLTEVRYPNWPKTVLPHRPIGAVTESATSLRVVVGGLTFQEPYSVAKDRPLYLTFTAVSATTVQPTLTRDGAVIRLGTAQAVNALLPLDVTQPGITSADAETRRYVRATTAARILIAPHGRAAGMRWAALALQHQRDPRFRQMIVAAGLMWDGADAGNKGLAAKWGVTVERKPSVLLVTYTGGPTEIDVLSSPLSVTGGTAINRQNFMWQAGMLLSAMERTAINLATGGAASVSAEAVMTEAKRQGVPVKTVRRYEDLPGITFQGNDRDEILRHARSGYVVAVPQRPITIGNWTGSAFIVYGYQGSMDPVLSGAGLAHGGATVGIGDVTVALALALTVEAAASIMGEAGAGLAVAGLALTVTGNPAVGITVAAVGAFNIGLAAFTLAVVVPAIRNCATCAPAPITMRVTFPDKEVAPTAPTGTSGSGSGPTGDVTVPAPTPPTPAPPEGLSMSLSLSVVGIGTQGTDANGVGPDGSTGAGGCGCGPGDPGSGLGGEI